MSRYRAAKTPPTARKIRQMAKLLDEGVPATQIAHRYNLAPEWVEQAVETLRRR